MKPVLIYVDDEIHNLAVFQASLPDDWEIHTFDNPQIAIEMFAKLSPWVIVSDQRMPGISGLEVLTAARDKAPEAKRIMATAYSDEELLIETIRRAKIYDFIPKPWDTDFLETTLRRAIEAYMTERENKRLQGELTEKEVAYKAAVAANEQRSLFLANMSHELRTPLNAIIGYSELLLDETGEDAAFAGFSADLQKILQSGRHLLSMVNDVLDITQLEHNSLSAHPKQIELAGLIDEIKVIIEPLMAKSRNQFHIINDDAPATLFADPMRVKQILINLLSNASKFTDEGTVTLRMGRLDSNVLLSVEDSGIGIQENDIARLFSIFSQVDMSSTKSVEGTGLGLALSQRLAQLMGGCIAVTSKYGHGSTFTLSLPCYDQNYPAEHMEEQKTNAESSERLTLN